MRWRGEHGDKPGGLGGSRGTSLSQLTPPGRQNLFGCEGMTWWSLWTFVPPPRRSPPSLISLKLLIFLSPPPPPSVLHPPALQPVASPPRLPLPAPASFPLLPSGADYRLCAAPMLLPLLVHPVSIRCRSLSCCLHLTSPFLLLTFQTGETVLFPVYFLSISCFLFSFIFRPVSFLTGLTGD